MGAMTSWCFTGGYSTWAPFPRSCKDPWQVHGDLWEVTVLS